jgi:hypothetical protein
VKIFGYLVDGTNNQPLQLAEISVLSTSESLRSLAAFLLDAASQLDRNPIDFDHVHWSDYDQKTSLKYPDIVVVNASKYP